MSNRAPDWEATEGAAEAAEVGAEELKRLSISALAERAEAAAGVLPAGGTGAETGSSPPVPKMSARRSWVDGPVVGTLIPLDPAEGAEPESSPIKSTIESLSVLVDPTGFRSLTRRSNVSDSARHELRRSNPTRKGLRYSSFASDNQG
jgi:hypothetical protein